MMKYRRLHKGDNLCIDIKYSLQHSVISLKDKKQQGFAIIAALMALLILTAVGALVFTITTQDIRVSTRVVGEKKAFSSAQAGIHALVEYSNSPAVQGKIENYTTSYVQVDASVDPYSKYEISNVPTNTYSNVPTSLKMPQYAGWEQTITVKGIRGVNERYGSNVQIDAAIGYGPIDTSLSHR